MSDQGPPLFTVLNGEPDDAELAALTAVLLALEHQCETDTRAAAAVPAPWLRTGYTDPRGWRGDR
ncbi:acyl-CoA carboxylase epsilon subunit [Actinokineospora diospyrosa]|uniref:Acyl-CoA carboxylase epsilon subunit n=1 Tax=Actinokineospora diospyrosa TaxID=103728 RepID=A0ABT1IDU4_9PSEU|nr:acyl-CoA carboxylase epsilon subunit [Actinokineospora diospyrosa]MCP2270812.1 Acyl-CoA carboxylase epsilon subunit [Actinokineospora diospyrosa]